MKNLTLVAVIITVMSFLSCQKEFVAPEDVNPPNNPPGIPSALTLSKLQYKWNLVSLFLYPTVDLTGSGLPIVTGNGLQYFDFRSDMKLYTFIQNSYDTSNYVMLSDSVFKLNQYYNGILSTHTDTATIRILSNNAFVFSFRTTANEFGKFTLNK